MIKYDRLHIVFFGPLDLVYFFLCLHAFSFFSESLLFVLFAVFSFPLDLSFLFQECSGRTPGTSRIFQEECVADGYKMPAGCIKVALENGSVKYVP